MSDCIAFGDDINDLSMIETAGIGSAMRNGVETVKKKADIIADENKCGGVGKLILEIIK